MFGDIDNKRGTEKFTPNFVNLLKSPPNVFVNIVSISLTSYIFISKHEFDFFYAHNCHHLMFLQYFYS